MTADTLGLEQKEKQLSFTCFELPWMVITHCVLPATMRHASRGTLIAVVFGEIGQLQTH